MQTTTPRPSSSLLGRAPLLRALCLPAALVFSLSACGGLQGGGSQNLSALSERLGALESADLDARLNSLELANLQSRVGLLEESNSGARLNALEDADFGGRLDVIENGNFDNRLNTLEGAGLLGRIATVETDVTIIDTNVTALSITQGEQAAAVEANSLSAANNLSELVTLQDEVGTLDSSVQGVANTLSTLGGEVTNNADALALLDTDLASLEADVVANVPVRTTLSYSGGTTKNSVNTSWVEMRVLGTFTKLEDDTDIQLTWFSHVSTSSGDYCNFQPRIDGVATGNGAGAVVSTGWDGATPVAVPQSYSGLSAGTHTVSLWVRGHGFTVSCMENQTTSSTNYTAKVYIEEGPAS